MKIPRLIIIDDDRLQLESWREIFIDKGYEVLVFRQLNEGEAFLRAHGNVKSDLVILDLMFALKARSAVASDPDFFLPGMHLYTDFLKGRFKTIVLTGALRYVPGAKSFAAVVESTKGSRLIQKPIDVEQLLCTVSTVWDEV